MRERDRATARTPSSAGSRSGSCAAREGRPRREDVRGIGIGVPGAGRASRRRAGRAADHARLGRLSPSRAGFADRFDAPVLVDNDVNMMALGEHGQLARRRPPALVKVGTGIGCGIVADGGGSTAARRAARRHRPHPRARPRATCSAAAATTAASRPSPAAARIAARARRAGPPARAARDVVRPRPRRASPRRSRSSGRRAATRRGARRAGQLLQPGRDRDRRRSRPRARAPAGRRPRGRLPALAAAGDASTCGSCRSRSTTARAWSAPRSWSSSTSSRRTRSTARSRRAWPPSYCEQTAVGRVRRPPCGLSARSA